MKIQDKINCLVGLALIVSCNSNGIPLEVKDDIERKINIGMKTYGSGYLTYASGKVYDKKGNKYGWYTTGAGGKIISNTRITNTLVIRNHKTQNYEIEVDLIKKQITKISKK